MRLNNLFLCLSAGLMMACSPTDFFLGEDNRPEPKPLPQINATVQTQVLWSDNLGDGGEDAALALMPDGDQSTVYAVSADGEFAAYDVDTGTKRFSRSLDKAITAGVRYAGGVVLLGTRNGELLALSSADGHMVWRANIGSAIFARPAAAGNMAVVRSNDGGVYAYNLQDGNLIWQYRISEPQLTIRGYAEPVIGGGVVILTTDGGQFVILDQSSGLPVAERRMAIGEGHNDIQRLVDMDATPKINQGVLYGSAYQANTFAVDLQSGAPLWEQPAVSTAQDFAMSPDAIFLHDDIDHVYALNQRDGSIRWNNDELEGRALSPMIAMPGRVGSVDGDGYLHWLDINTGKLIGQSKIGSSNALGEPYIGQRSIVWQLADGEVVAVRPQ